MTRATVTAVGSGALPVAEAGRLWRSWRVRAGSMRAAPADPRALAMMGIRMVVVPPKGTPDA